MTKPTENTLTASTKTDGGKAEPADAELGMEHVLRALEMLMNQCAEGEERRRKARAEGQGTACFREGRVVVPEFGEADPIFCLKIL
jgi:hypothetical protein